jgi:hypothetical protein
MEILNYMENSHIPEDLKDIVKDKVAENRHRIIFNKQIKSELLKKFVKFATRRIAIYYHYIISHWSDKVVIRSADMIKNFNYISGSRINNINETHQQYLIIYSGVKYFSIVININFLMNNNLNINYNIHHSDYELYVYPNFNRCSSPYNDQLKLYIFEHLNRFDLYPEILEFIDNTSSIINDIHCVDFITCNNYMKENTLMQNINCIRFEGIFDTYGHKYSDPNVFPPITPNLEDVL